MIIDNDVMRNADGLYGVSWFVPADATVTKMRTTRISTRHKSTAATPNTKHQTPSNTSTLYAVNKDPATAEAAHAQREEIIIVVEHRLPDNLALISPENYRK
jgi:hypothetical protein